MSEIFACLLVHSSPANKQCLVYSSSSIDICSLKESYYITQNGLLIQESLSLFKSTPSEIIRTEKNLRDYLPKIKYFHRRLWKLLTDNGSVSQDQENVSASTILPQP